MSHGLRFVFRGMKGATVALLAGLFSAGCFANQADADAENQNLSITIYNDLSLINDQRRVSLFEGSGKVVMPSISPKIIHDSVRLQSEGDFDVLDQNYHYDLLTPRNLLEKHVGDNVTVVRRVETGPDMVRKDAKLLAVQDSQAVFRFNNGSIGTTGFGDPYFFEFDSVPQALYSEPTLSWNITSRSSGEKSWDISYLTKGLSWKTAYVMTLNEAQDQASLSGWVTISNDSGIAYPEADIDVVAGSPNRASSTQRQRQFQREAMAMQAAGAAKPDEQSLGQYKIYDLPNRYDIAASSSKQIALLSAEAIPVEVRNYTAFGRGHQRQKPDGFKVQAVTSRLHFDNESPHLGRALPKGVVRIMRPGPDGQMRFMGEDRIANTADKESVSLKMGRAFDLNTHFRRTSYETKLNGDIRLYTYEVVVKNGGDEKAEVELKSPRLKGDWEVTEASDDYEKLNDSTITWNLAVPAKGEKRMTVSIRERH